MSELKNYIFDTLKNEYEKLGVLSETSVNSLTAYRHTNSGKKLVLIQSAYRNDDVFRKLRGVNTNGFTPMIYEVSGEEDFLFVLEEYVEGTPLSCFLKEDKKISDSELKGYLLDLCDALGIIHSLGIVHRDVKPENVIIRNGRACLIDFSVSRIISYSETDTSSLGTAGYAAPEQYGVSESLPTADIYALGVLANILSTGVHPTAEIPKGRLGKIIKKCTELQTSQRYQSAAELKKALQKL